MPAHTPARVDVYAERYLRLPEVQAIVTYSKVHLYRMERRGDFPRRLKLGPNRVVWKLSEILAWVERKRAASATVGTDAG